MNDTNIHHTSSIYMYFKFFFFHFTDERDINHSKSIDQFNYLVETYYKDIVNECPDSSINDAILNSILNLY